ncbi:hypothetical protein [Dethiobacter alkaliphilus]|uniref:hypothetical protein n=1 Tax=Dethiobacter alkaliphilus TaxID=427926 RepID=UPI0022261927|nr:hypothetical protein [Dethiobacter alkaliphilus]MCW3490722.1 hypothetical protein [Dethiobacter alkaliphilus]
MKNTNLLLPGLAGGILFALVYTILFYLQNQELSYVGFLGGFVFWLTNAAIAAYSRRDK